jgi:hypothetical protein
MITGPFDGVVITDLIGAAATFDQAVQRFGGERVFAPAFLGLADRTGALEIAS